MTILEEIAKATRLGRCVVLGAGDALDPFRGLLQEFGREDYLIIGQKGSVTARLMASKMYGQVHHPRSLTIDELEMDIYLISSS